MESWMTAISGFLMKIPVWASMQALPLSHGKTAETSIIMTVQGIALRIRLILWQMFFGQKRTKRCPVWAFIRLVIMATIQNIRFRFIVCQKQQLTRPMANCYWIPQGIPEDLVIRKLPCRKRFLCRRMSDFLWYCRWKSRRIKPGKMAIWPLKKISMLIIIACSFLPSQDRVIFWIRVARNGWMPHS